MVDVSVTFDWRCSGCKMVNDDRQYRLDEFTRRNRFCVYSHDRWKCALPVRPEPAQLVLILRGVARAKTQRTT